MLDYHLHLWPHSAPPPARFGHDEVVDQVAAYWEAARAAGADAIAVTEHLSRFTQGAVAAGRWWAGDGDAGLVAATDRCWADEAVGDLDAYVEALLAARAAGVPVAVGLEVDHCPGRSDAVADLLAGYPFDVLLGSVHFLGAWGFDNLDDPAMVAEWDARSVDAVWDAYTTAVEDLAASGTADVLAHVDLVKLTGRRPDLVAPFHERLAEAAGRAGLAVEVSSAGWRRPVGEAYPAADLLDRLVAAGTPLTTASDAHRLADVGDGLDRLARVLGEAGRRLVTGFERRRPALVGAA